MNDKDTSILKNRIIELARRSDERSIYCFTDFLGLLEQSVFNLALREIGGIKYTLFGGSENCERLMVRFGDPGDLGYEEDFPISCLKIEPVDNPGNGKPDFSHRDILGACINIGITRAALGDIFIKEDGAYIFCTDVIAPVIEEELTRVRHSMVKCSRYTGDRDFLAPTLTPAKCRVSSIRLDAVISKLFNLSRERGQELFAKNRIFINGRQCTNPHNSLADGDIISVRGFGRFVYHGTEGRTKKDKEIVNVELFGGN